MSGTRLLAILWLLGTGALIAMPFAGVSDGFRLYYSNAGQVSISLVSALICFSTMNAFPSESALGKVWGAIAAGILAWAIAAAIFASYPLLNSGEDTPFPYYSDIFYLMTSPLMTVGLLMFKRSAGLESPLWGKMLALVALLGTGFMAYRANAEGLADPDLTLKLTTMGYFAFDPILFSVTLLTASSFRGGDVAASWWFVVAGILLYYISNQLYNYLVISEQYTTGSPIDAGWMLGFGLIACGAIRAKKLLG